MVCGSIGIFWTNSITQSQKKMRLVSCTIWCPLSSPRWRTIYEKPLIENGVILRWYSLFYWSLPLFSSISRISERIIFIIFTKPSAQAGYDTRSIVQRSLTGLNSEYFFSKTSCLTKAEEPSLSYYLPIAGGRIIGFIPFLRVLVLCEMQSVSSRIWTRIALSISIDDNHYTKGNLNYIYSPYSSFNLFVKTLYPCSRTHPTPYFNK